jgi:LysR family transcriptional regulator for bpeEF and oprC
VEVLPHLKTIPKPVSLLLSDRKYRSPNVRAFMDWLVAIFKEHQRA